MYFPLSKINYDNTWYVTSNILELFFHSCNLNIPEFFFSFPPNYSDQLSNLLLLTVLVGLVSETYVSMSVCMFVRFLNYI